MSIKRVILFVLLLILSVHLKAQAYRCDTLEFSVFFPWDKSAIDMTFKDNGTRLSEFQTDLNRLTADSTAIIRYFSIYTSTSPEGTVEHNRILSDARAKSIRKYLTEELGVDSRLIQIESIGEDWGRLRHLLESMDSPPHWVSRALEIIDSYSCRQTDDIEVPLKYLDGGRAWAYISENFFPQLRSAGSSVTCIIQRPVKEIINHTDTVFISHRDTVYIDDIFGYNSNVTIRLPDVSTLNLSGYNLAKVHNLFWAEDYLTNDINYDKGLKLKGNAWNSDKTNQRYRDVREKGMAGDYFFVDFNNKSIIEYTNKYLALTMGWDVSTITIIKTGMLDGENAVFKLYSGTGTTKAEYMTVVLTDRDKQGDGTRVKHITLNTDGWWEVQETGWAWAYRPNVYSISRNLDATSEEEDRIFRFTNTVNTNVPEHAESIVVNHMQSSVAEFTE